MAKNQTESKPEHPLADEWFRVATAPITLEAKWERFKDLRARHLAADKYEFEQGKAKGG